MAVRMARREGATGAPRWVVPLYFVGLLFVYLGERALSAFETGAQVFTWLGVLAVAGSVVVRLLPRYRGEGSQRPIERLMLGLSLGGLVALGIYALTTPFMASRLGSDEVRDGILTVAWLGFLLLCSVPLAFAEVARAPMLRAEHPESRRVLAAAVSGATLAAAAIYGALFVGAASSVDLSVDYSYMKTSRPGEATKKLASSAPDDVEVTAFFPEVNEVKREVESYLAELGRGAPGLRVRMVDRLLEPGLAKQRRATQDGVIVVSKGTMNHALVVGTDLVQARPQLKTLDRDFQAALLKVIRARRNAYLTVGHGELNEARGDSGPLGVRGVRQILEKQNYAVRDLGLSEGLARDVPDDAGIVLVLGPTRPFGEAEIASLKRYAERGGKLFLALDASLPEATEGIAEGQLVGSLERLAEIASVRLDASLLAHPTAHASRARNASDRAMLVTSAFSSHPSVSTLSRLAPRSAIVVQGAASLEKLDGTAKETRVDLAIRTPAGTFADTDRDYQKDDQEPSKAFAIAAAASRPVKNVGDSPSSDAEESNEMRVFVLADADALTDLFMINAPNNPYLFVDAIRWLGGEESVAGAINSEEDVLIEHTKKEDQLWFYSIIFGVPGLVLGAGLLLRRHSRRRATRQLAGGTA